MVQSVVINFSSKVYSKSLLKGSPLSCRYLSIRKRKGEGTIYFPKFHGTLTLLITKTDATLQIGII